MLRLIFDMTEVTEEIRGKPRFGDVFEVKNKDTGKNIFYDDHSRNSIFECVSNNKKDSYEFYIYGFRKIDRDSRPSFIKVIHRLIEKNLQHEFSLVFDGTHNYRKLRKPHLNLTQDANSVLSNCQTCEKYFSSFNHYEIFPIKDSVDADFIWEQVNLDLKDNHFFENYQCSYYKKNL